MLADENPTEVLAAVKLLTKSKKRNQAFAPSVGEILQAIDEIKNPDMRDTSEVFLSGPHNAETDQERQAWQRWGGSSRWGGLPDRNPRWCDNLEKADQIWRKAEKEFAAILDGLNDRAARHHAIEATPDEARNFLALVAKKRIGGK